MLSKKIKRKDLKAKLEALIGQLKKESWPKERLMDLPLHYEVPDGDDKLQVEINFLEYEGERAHISVSLDDGTFFNSVFPVTSGFYTLRAEGGAVAKRERSQT